MMKPIHDRMPVILKPDDWKIWLDPDIVEGEALRPLFEPYGSDKMDAYEVSTYVNSPAHDDKKAIEPI